MSTSGDELSADFEAVAQDDPDMRIDLHGIGNDMVATLAAGRAHPDSTRRFEDLAKVAASRFDPDGTGDALARWLRLVANNVPLLVARDAVGGTIRNAAHASALVVRRLRNRPPLVVDDASPRRRRKRTDADKARDEGNIAAHLLQHPDATRDEVASATEIAAAHVSASVAWRSHKVSQKAARNANRARASGGVGDPSVDRYGGGEDDD